MQPRRVVRHTVEMRFEADRVRIDLVRLGLQARFRFGV